MQNGDNPLSPPQVFPIELGEQPDFLQPAVKAVSMFVSPRTIRQAGMPLPLLLLIRILPPLRYDRRLLS